MTDLRQTNAIIPFALLLFVWMLAGTKPTFGQVNVLTSQYNNQRSGANTNEQTLNTTNVNENTFGKLLKFGSWNGYVTNQPLYVANLSVSGQKHNMLYLTTDYNYVLAYDADSGILIWSAFEGTPPPYWYGNRATSVIDLSSNTIYVDSYSVEDNNSVYRLHALDLTTGAEKFGGPVVIDAHVPGNAYDSVNGVVSFDAYQQDSRLAMSLINGVIYLGFATKDNDVDPYHGWLLGYSELNLKQVSVFNDTPNGGEGGIWMCGCGPVVDSSNNIYLSTGNSFENAENNTADYGESFVKLTPSSNGLKVTDYFKANNYDYLNSADGDVGAGGLVAIPGTNYIVGGGKQGLFYLVDTNNMGHLNLNKDQVVEEWQADNGLWGGPVYWNSATTPSLFVWSSNDVLKAYRFANGVFNTTPSSEGNINAGPPSGGTGISISSNQNVPGTGILWGLYGTEGGGNATQTGALIALDATNLSKVLYNSSAKPSRDGYGSLDDYIPPVVANGKVFVMSPSSAAVFGILPTAVPAAVSGLTANPGNHIITLSWPVPATATSFNVARSSSAAGPFVTLKTKVAATAYTDTGLANGAGFYYTVSANNEFGTGSPSSIVSASASAISGTLLSVQSASGTCGQTVSLSGILKSVATSAALPGKTLTFTVDSISAGTAVTNSNGIAKLVFVIPDAFAFGVHTITVSFAGDYANSSCSNTANLSQTQTGTVLSVANVSAPVGSTATLSAALKTTAGLPGVGQVIEFIVDDAPLGTAVTNSVGEAVFPFPVPQATYAQTHTITASFVGNFFGGPSVGNGTLTVSNIMTTTHIKFVYAVAGQPVSLTGSLISNGFPIPSATISFYLASQLVGTGVTNDDGVATYTYILPITTHGGDTAISSEFAGNSTYAPSSASSYISVTAPTVITVSPAAGQQGTPVTLVATLAPAAGGAIGFHEALTFSVDGFSIGTATTTSNGLAQFTVTVPMSEPLGSHTITVSFAGANNFGSSTGTGIGTVVQPT